MRRIVLLVCIPLLTFGLHRILSRRPDALPAPPPIDCARLSASERTACLPAPGIEPKHLAFQVFTNAPSWREPPGDSGHKALRGGPPKEELAAFVADLKARVGWRGNTRNQLAFILGPISFDHDDTEAIRLIEQGFEIALEHGIAVGFHLDDSMFWAARTDLLADPGNIEWLDYRGTPNTGRQIDWGKPGGATLPPQMCFNSPAILREVDRRARHVIGAAIQRGRQRLRAAGRDELFAGVVAGWETQVGRDFATKRPLGYCALSRLGYAADRPPRNEAAAIDAVVKDFVERWTSGLAAAGIPRESLYSHLIPASRELAFGRFHRPGFTTYPQPGLMKEIYASLAAHQELAWASAEGTNSGGMGESMETYLAQKFNHGAALVVLFGWGIGDSANPYRAATEHPEAIAAYRKFLSGQPLGETAPAGGSLPQKIALLREHQRRLQGAQKRVAPLLPKFRDLDEAMERGDFPAAHRTADELLHELRAFP